MVEKRTIKISVAVMAIAALVMGLAIGLGQKNKNDKTSSASSLQAFQRQCDVSAASTEGKAGKGPTAPSEGKAGKADVRRELIVPGTEDAAVSLGSGKRRMMKEELLRGINQRQLKSGKGGCKSSKNGAPCRPRPQAFDCIAVLDVCENAKSAKTPSEGKSGKSGPTSPSEGKSGKSGPTSPSEGKSGKSGPTSPSEGKSGKSGPTSPSCGKSGKSNGDSGGDCAAPASPTVTCAKTVKSAKTPSCGKSGKSNGSNTDDCEESPIGGASFITPAPSPLVSAGSSETVGKDVTSDTSDPWQTDPRE